jgi:hypothetical protein
MSTNSLIFTHIMSPSNILLTPTHGRRNRTFQPICLQWSRVSSDGFRRRIVCRCDSFRSKHGIQTGKHIHPAAKAASPKAVEHMKVRRSGTIVEYPDSLVASNSEEACTTHTKQALHAQNHFRHFSLHLLWRARWYKHSQYPLPLYTWKPRWF